MRQRQRETQRERETETKPQQELVGEREGGGDVEGERNGEAAKKIRQETEVVRGAGRRKGRERQAR